MFLNFLLFDVIILLFRDGNGVSAIHYLIRRVPTIIALPGILTSNCHHNDYSVTMLQCNEILFFFYNFHKRSAILLFEEARVKYTRGRSHITSAAGGGRGGKPKADNGGQGGNGG